MANPPSSKARRRTGGTMANGKCVPVSEGGGDRKEERQKRQAHCKSFASSDVAFLIRRSLSGSEPGRGGKGTLTPALSRLTGEGAGRRLFRAVGIAESQWRIANGRWQMANVCR